MGRRRYRNPPIQEVICEIGLDGRTAWDLAVPGLLYERLRDEFPQRERRRVQEVELAQSPGGSALTVKDSERAVFLSSDRRRLVQVGERLLAVNQLSPYGGWEAFKKSVDIAYNALRDVVEIKGIRVLTARYIDKIEISAPSLLVEDYFRFRPYLEGLHEGEPLDNWQAFIVGIQTPLDDGRDALRIQLGTVPSAPEKETFMLEIAYSLARAGAVEPSAVTEWLETAHERIVEAFERAITDKLRALFQPE